MQKRDLRRSWIVNTIRENGVVQQLQSISDVVTGTPAVHVLHCELRNRAN